MPPVDSKRFVCAECGKSFGRRPDLNRHAAVHDPDAVRFYCTYSGCDHSTLQKSNLKTHYISKHLNLRPHKCRLDDCTKSYGDASALIRHEKDRHGYYRKEHKPYGRPSSVKKSYVKVEMPSPSLTDSITAPSLCYSSSSAPSPAPFDRLSMSCTSFFVPGEGCYMRHAYAPSQSDAFLHEMIPDLFPDPWLNQCVTPANTFDTNFLQTNERDFLRDAGLLDEFADLVRPPFSL